ncbi:MAG: Plug and carboxypeptidase regulatory-like domain-containing protein [Longimicrobiales bacterium]|nr:Plug and carboxypeptidase regulatory-like domain-containing protein [Longimicrobiales bacterium]
MTVVEKAAICLCLLVCAATPVMGQSIHGRILVGGDSIGVGGAELVLIDSTGTSLLRVQSDSLGMFRIPVPEAGHYEILATRLGFASVRAGVEVGEREIVEVEFRMAEEAIPLDPIVVVARREIRRGTLDEFYDRMDRNKQRGVGWFFTKEDIEKREYVSLPLFLNTAPGVMVQGSRGSVQIVGYGPPCTPTFYIDGFETSYRELQMMDLEGIEIYRGRFENVAGYFTSDCGAIFLWRKPDWGNPFSWGRVAVVGGLLALLIALGSLF